MIFNEAAFEFNDENWKMVRRGQVIASTIVKSFK